jgi:hypothetical protein
MIQNTVENGADHQSAGMPRTKRPVYRCFCVMVCSPTCVASGAAVPVRKGWVAGGKRTPTEAVDEDEAGDEEGDGAEQPVVRDEGVHCQRRRDHTVVACANNLISLHLRPQRACAPEKYRVLYVTRCDASAPARRQQTRAVHVPRWPGSCPPGATRVGSRRTRSAAAARSGASPAHRSRVSAAGAGVRADGSAHADVPERVGHAQCCLHLSGGVGRRGSERDAGVKGECEARAKRRCIKGAMRSHTVHGALHVRPPLRRAAHAAHPLQRPPR